MKRCFLFVVLWTMMSMMGYAQRLVDVETQTPLPWATITDRDGNVIGRTNQEGLIPEIDSCLFPVTFVCIGYEPLTVERLSGNDIGMELSVSELPEVLISPTGRPFLHLTGYLRVTTSVQGSPNSVTAFMESIVDFMLPIEKKTKKKGWNHPRELASKRYMRKTGADGLDSIGYDKDLAFLLSAGIYFPQKNNNIAKAFNIEAKTLDGGTVMGKYAPKVIVRRNGNSVHIFADGLADRKEHRFSPWQLKLLGFTTEFTDMHLNGLFQTDGGSEILFTDLQQLSMSVSALVRSRFARKKFGSTEPLDCKAYVELFVTGREYLTEDEAEQLRQTPPAVSEADVKAPAEAPALHPGIREIVERTEAMK